MKMTSLKKSNAERKDEKNERGFSLPEGAPEHDGVSIHLEPHHLEKMGLAGKMEHGDSFELKGRGYVHKAENSSDESGEHHRAHLIMTHGGIEHESHNPETERDDMRRDVGRAVDEAEKKVK